MHMCWYLITELIDWCLITVVICWYLITMLTCWCLIILLTCWCLKGVQRPEKSIERCVLVRVWYNISIVFPYVYKWLCLLSGGKCFNDKLFCFGTRRKSTSSQLGLSKPTLGREMGNEKWDWDKSRGQDQWRQNGREAEGKDDRETIEKSRQRRVMGGYTNIISCSRHWLQK